MNQSSSVPITGRLLKKKITGAMVLFSWAGCGVSPGMSAWQESKVLELEKYSINITLWLLSGVQRKYGKNPEKVSHERKPSGNILSCKEKL